MIPSSVLIADYIEIGRVLIPDDIIIRKWTGKGECVLHSSQLRKIIKSKTPSKIRTGNNRKIPCHPYPVIKTRNMDPNKCG